LTSTFKSLSSFVFFMIFGSIRNWDHSQIKKLKKTEITQNQ